jgi:hypothetical protein
VRVDPAEREFRATSPHEEEEEIEGWMANEEWSDNVHCCETIWSMRTVVFVLCLFEHKWKKLGMQKVTKVMIYMHKYKMLIIFYKMSNLIYLIFSFTLLSFPFLFEIGIFLLFSFVNVLSYC